MPYATLADLKARFGELELIQLTDIAALGVIDEAVVAQALADTEAMVDGYLGGRYTLPLASVPAILVSVVCDLARARLYKDAAPEIVIQRHQDALRYLDRLALGRITLGAVPEPASTNDARIASEARRRDGLGL